MKKRTPLFEVEKLRVERDAVILHEVNWRVERGQHWVILGANGSGKTSLLSALTGYLMPTSGEIRIGAARFGAADWREVRQSVGLVSPSLEHQIEPDQTAREVVLSGREAEINFWGRVPVAEERQAARVLRQVRAGHLAERPWRYLSQGERQRALIGRALMARLSLLFLDEPAAGLDPVAREDFLAFLGVLAKGPPRADARFSDASRGGNRAALHPRLAFARRQDARRRGQGRGADLAPSFRYVWRARGVAPFRLPVPPGSGASRGLVRASPLIAAAQDFRIAFDRQVGQHHTAGSAGVVQW